MASYKSKVTGLTPQMGSDAARRLRCALNGKKRTAFWRRQGFPNLKKATAIGRLMREHHCDKLTARAIFAQEQAGLPYQVPETSFFEETQQEKPAPRARQLSPLFESVRSI